MYQTPARIDGMFIRTYVYNFKKQTNKQKKTRIQKKAKEAKEEKKNISGKSIEKIFNGKSFNGNLLTAKSLQLYCKKKSMVCEF